MRRRWGPGRGSACCRSACRSRSGVDVSSKGFTRGCARWQKTSACESSGATLHGRRRAWALTPSCWARYGAGVLQVLESAGVRTSRSRAARGLALRQRRPAPRVEWGVLLSEKGLATSLIDLSDGLSSDLAHVCRASGVGARVEAASLPVDPLLVETGLDTDEALRVARDGGG